MRNWVKMNKNWIECKIESLEENILEDQELIKEYEEWIKEYERRIKVLEKRKEGNEIELNRYKWKNEKRNIRENEMYGRKSKWIGWDGKVEDEEENDWDKWNKNFSNESVW